jgi:hypothetical protein
VDEKETAHTGGLMVARPERALRRFDSGQRRTRKRKDGGEGAVGCARGGPSSAGALGRPAVHLNPTNQWRCGPGCVVP